MALSRTVLAASLALCLAPSGCVSQRQYDEALADLQKARLESADRARRIATLEADVARLGVDMADRDKKLADATTTQADLTRKVDDLTLMNAELAERLRKAGQSVEQLASERGNLSSALAETRRKLEELSRLQAAAEARAAQFRDLQEKLKKLVDAGELTVVMRAGRMILALPNDVLFDSGKTDIKPIGKQTITKVAEVLRTLAGRKFQVAGHTDDVKIQSPRFPSNWELSTARAVEVTKLLVGGGMPETTLSAAGYGEFDPVMANDTPENRQKNRRIEITLVPDLNELIVPADKK
jgi:chemotaxis protein MotB